MGINPKKYLGRELSWSSQKEFRRFKGRARNANTISISKVSLADAVVKET